MTIGDGTIGDGSIGGRPLEVDRTGETTVRVNSLGRVDTESSGRALTFAAEEPELVETMSPRRDISERERLEGYLKSPFQTPTLPSGAYEQTEFGSLIAMFAELAEAMDAVRIELLAEQYVGFARGQQLDEIGHQVFVYRWDGEEDDDYRARIRAAYLRIVSGGTIDEVRKSVAVLLRTDVENIHIEEPFGATTAAFDVLIDPDVLEESAVPDWYIQDHIDGVKAQGVRGDALSDGWFEFRSEEEYEADADDEILGPERGWDAGPWTGRLVDRDDRERIFEFRSDEAYESDVDDEEIGPLRGWSAGWWRGTRNF